MTRRLQATENDLLQVFSRLAPQHLYSRYIFFHLLIQARKKSPASGAHYVLHLCRTLDQLGIYDERIEKFFIHVCQGNIGAMATILDAYTQLVCTPTRLLDALEHRYPLDHEAFARELQESGMNYRFCLRGALTEYRSRSICPLSDSPFARKNDETDYLARFRDAKPAS